MKFFKFKILFILYFLVPLILVAEDKGDFIYGGRSLGFLFHSPFVLKAPFSSPRSYPEKEFWSYDGKIWIRLATIKNRNHSSEDEIQKMFGSFFFPGKTQSLKRTKKKKWTIMSGKVYIEGEPYLLKVKYLLRKDFFHIIFIFCDPEIPEIWKKIGKSVQINPNFQPF